MRRQWVVYRRCRYLGHTMLRAVLHFINSRRQQTPLVRRTPLEGLPVLTVRQVFARRCCPNSNWSKFSISMQRPMVRWNSVWSIVGAYHCLYNVMYQLITCSNDRWCKWASAARRLSSNAGWVCLIACGQIGLKLVVGVLVYRAFCIHRDVERLGWDSGVHETMDDGPLTL